MISVCLASYNGERFLREQIDSILVQLTEDDELVVSDDGSTDSTLEILKSFNDPRIKILHNRGNHGVNGNFENAIMNAKGDYIFLSDQDDVWLPGKVGQCLNALTKYDCVIHDAIVTNGDLTVISESFFSERKSGGGFWKNLYKNTYVGCCMAFRRDMLKYVLPYPKDLPIFQEGWVAMLSEINGKVAFIDFKGILFRRHSSNTSFTARKSSFTLPHQLSYRLRLLKLIAKRQYLISFRSYRYL